MTLLGHLFHALFAIEVLTQRIENREAEVERRQALADRALAAAMLSKTAVARARSRTVTLLEQTLERP